MHVSQEESSQVVKDSVNIKNGCFLISLINATVFYVSSMCLLAADRGTTVSPR